jgi:hypothetical protein
MTSGAIHLEGRKETMAMILAKAGSGIRFNEHLEGDGETAPADRPIGSK